MYKRLVLSLTTIFVILLATTSASMNPRYSTGAEWPTIPSTIMWYCGQLSASERAAAQAAMTTWNAVRANDNSLLLTSVSTTNPSSTLNSIYRDTLESGVIAKAYTSPQTGYIEYATIRLSSNDVFSIGATNTTYDLQSTILHELGHTYGIAHCHEITDSSCSVIGCPNNVMSPVGAIGANRRILQSYDITSYRYVYVS